MPERFPRSRRPRADPALIAALRARIRRIEGFAAGDGARPLPLGDAIDGALPWGGLPRAALHEVTGDAAAGFCATLAARLAGERGTVLWCRRGPGLYGPGLAGLGLALERLILVRARRTVEVLWAMEEGLRSGAPAAVVGEAEGVSAVAARRLKLAAEAGGVAGLVLGPERAMAAALPATTRWRVTPAPGADAFGGLGAPRWRVELLRCRGGRSASWLVEWNHDAAGGFRVVAHLRHGPDGASARPSATVADRLAG